MKRLLYQPQLEAFSETDDKRISPVSGDFIIERHSPNLFDNPYHHHTSIELNFLENCDMEYSFFDHKVMLERTRLTLFWGALPHRVTDLKGTGQITNVYLSLRRFLGWELPNQLGRAILSGAVVCSLQPDPMDTYLFDRLNSERDRKSADWHATHLGELEARLRRLALDGWETLTPSRQLTAPNRAKSGEIFRIEAMISYIAENFTASISVADIANSANLSPSRASILFQKVMGVSIKRYLTNTRLAHASMLLIESNAKVGNIALDSGFISLSAFYDAFGADFGVSPAKYRELRHVEG